MTITRVAGARIFGLPDDMAPPETRTEVLSKLLASYPSAVGWQSLLHRGVAAWQEHGAGWVARVQWQMPKPTGNDELRRDFLLTEVAPRSESLNRGWLSSRRWQGTRSAKRTCVVVPIVVWALHVCALPAGPVDPAAQRGRES